MECGSLLPLFFFLDVLQTLTQLVLPKHLFWNLPPTKCKFHKPFILIFMQIGGVYPPRIARCSSLKTENWELTTENGQSARSAKGPSDPEFTKYLQRTTDNYRSSRISLSFAADKSSIFLVSACEIFSISSSARFCSSWLIFFSFSSLSMVSLTSRRMLRTAVRWFSSTLCRCFTISLRRSSVGAGIGTRTTLPSLVGFSPRSEARIALSISPTTLGSHGEITSSVASGTVTVPS